MQIRKAAGGCGLEPATLSTKPGKNCRNRLAIQDNDDGAIYSLSGSLKPVESGYNTKTEVRSIVHGKISR